MSWLSMIQTTSPTFDPYKPSAPLSNRGSDSRAVLIVDDDKMARDRLRLMIAQTDSPNDLKIFEAESISEAITLIASNPIHVVLLDKELKRTASDSKMPIVDDGISTIPQLLDINPTLQILVVTGSREIEDCVRAMRLGALGYVTKSTPDEVLLAQLNKAVMVSNLTAIKIQRDLEEEARRGGIRFVGPSRAIGELKERLKAVSETSRPILLVGETGTGKTTAARYIHDLRLKRDQKREAPFLGLNMASFPSTLAERELFGNDRGAFTDAKEARPGYIELANGGTLFLDEIGDASLEIQAKLLKVIESGNFYRLGSSVERRSDFKLICATNRNLEQMITEGKFREDLYMRISTFIVPVPSLAERKQDLLLLIEDLLPKISRENNTVANLRDLPADLLAYLQEAEIPGNLRGLEAILSRVLIHCKKDRQGRPMLELWRTAPGVLRATFRPSSKNGLTMEELFSRPLNIFHSDFPGLSAFLADFRKRVVREALDRSKTKVEAARILKTTPANLSNECRKLNLPMRPLKRKLRRRKTK